LPGLCPRGGEEGGKGMGAKEWKAGYGWAYALPFFPLGGGPQGLGGMGLPRGM